MKITTTILFAVLTPVLLAGCDLEKNEYNEYVENTTVNEADAQPTLCEVFVDTESNTVGRNDQYGLRDMQMLRVHQSGCTDRGAETIIVRVKNDLNGDDDVHNVYRSNIPGLPSYEWELAWGKVHAVASAEGEDFLIPETVQMRDGYAEVEIDVSSFSTDVDIIITLSYEAHNEGGEYVRFVPHAGGATIEGDVDRTTVHMLQSELHQVYKDREDYCSDHSCKG